MLYPSGVIKNWINVDLVDEKIQKIAPINTQVSIECFGDDHCGNWVGNITLPDGSLINDILIQEGTSNFIKSYR